MSSFGLGDFPGIGGWVAIAGIGNAAVGVAGAQWRCQLKEEVATTVCALAAATIPVAEYVLAVGQIGPRLAVSPPPKRGSIWRSAHRHRSMTTGRAARCTSGLPNCIAFQLPNLA